MRLRKMSVVDPGCLMRLRAMPDAVPEMPSAAEPCPDFVCRRSAERINHAVTAGKCSSGDAFRRKTLPGLRSAEGPRSGPTMP